jgi:hypothetical protein
MIESARCLRRQRHLNTYQRGRQSRPKDSVDSSSGSMRERMPQPGRYSTGFAPGRGGIHGNMSSFARSPKASKDIKEPGTGGLFGGSIRLGHSSARPRTPDVRKDLQEHWPWQALSLWHIEPEGADRSTDSVRHGLHSYRYRQPTRPSTSWGSSAPSHGQSRGLADHRRPKKAW